MCPVSARTLLLTVGKRQLHVEAQMLVQRVRVFDGHRLCWRLLEE